MECYGQEYQYQSDGEADFLRGRGEKKSIIMAHKKKQKAQW